MGTFNGFSSERILLAALMSFSAGACTLIGALGVFAERFVKDRQRQILAAGLGFSAGVMLEVTFLEVLYKSRDGFLAAYDEGLAFLFMQLSFFGGMLLCGLLRFGVDLLARRVGAPDHHGGEETAAHLHADTEAPARVVEVTVAGAVTDADKAELDRLGLLAALAIALHNVPEGLVVFVATLLDPHLGGALVIGIAVHNIPEGLAVAMPVYYSSGSKLKAFVYAGVSGIAEPIGGCLGFLIIGSALSDIGLGTVFGVVAGMMMYIVIFDLLPTAYNYAPSAFVCALYVSAGILVMAISLVLFWLA